MRAGAVTAFAIDVIGPLDPDSDEVQSPFSFVKNCKLDPDSDEVQSPFSVVKH